MLTIKQNLLETIKGGNPDRFVNNFEFMELVFEVPGQIFPMPGQTVLNEWGITFSWPKDQIGCFPVHDDEHKLLKDITKWKEVVKEPAVEFPDEAWAVGVEHANAIDRNEKFVTAFMAPGLFEMTHHMMGMEDAMMNLYEEPEFMHELIDFLAGYELKKAKQIIDHLHPDALYHHDDWGGQISTFLSPDMFKEFYVEPYKKIYKFWRDNGTELIIHHSDSYGETLVPHMIEMGVDIWQGVMSSNDIPKLIQEYGGQMSFMGGLDSGPLDHPNWDAKVIEEETEKLCEKCGKLYFIPGLTQGGPYSSFPGVFDAGTAAIEKASKKMF